MAEIENGLSVLNERMERRVRSVPPARHEKTPVITEAPTEPAAQAERPPQTNSKPIRKQSPPQRKNKPQPVGKVVPMADEPKTSVTLRLRGSIDEAIERCAFNLRDLGVKGVSKGELVEMACAESIPQVPDEELAAKVRAYRAKLAASTGELA